MLELIYLNFFMIELNKEKIIICNLPAIYHKDHEEPKYRLVISNKNKRQIRKSIFEKRVLHFS